MRSSKSRSRSKANRPRTLGNIINRVFDSSGPEGKVRGTPQQIIEKYQHLARDAQLSNDRVAAENFSQHAEHYTRMLGEAMREMAAEQDQRRPADGQGQPRRDDWQPQQPYQNGNGNGGQGYARDGQRDQQPRQENRPDQRGEQRNDQRGDNRNDQRGDHRGDQRADGRGDRPDYRPENRNENRPDNRTDSRSDYRAEARQPAPVAEAEVIDLSDDLEGGLVETPEARSTVREAAPEARREEATPAEAPAKAERGPRRPRGPRKPRAEALDEGKGPADTQEAAE